MGIDFFCFSVPSLDSTDYVVQEGDSENTVWIKTKEKELMESARDNNMLVVFDRSTKKFYKDREEIDVRGKTIFPRSFMPYEEELLESLDSHGALSIQTLEDVEKVTKWPERIQPVYRKVIPTTYREFQENAENYRTQFHRIFLKTAKKSNIHCVLKYFGSISLDGKNYFGTKPTLWDLSLDDDIFLSEAFKSIEDKENDMDCREYRVFVLNNSLLSISRSYVDYPTEVPNEVMAFAEEQIRRASSIPDFPKSYVIDVGEVLMNGSPVIDIVEYNSIASSGLEVCNCLVDSLLQQKKSALQYVKKNNES